MAKAYKAGKTTSLSTVSITGVRGNPGDYRVYLFADFTAGNSYINFSNVTLTKSGSAWALKTGVVTGGTVTIYWALVKKSNPSQGKPIVKMGSGTTKTNKLTVSACADCKVLGSTTGPCYTYSKTFSVGNGQNPEQLIRWISMKKSSFLTGIKLL